MAVTPSTMAPLGTPAPDFALPDPDGKVFGLADFRAAPALLVMFLSNHCPFVKHLKKDLAAFASEYQAKGLAVVAIAANDFTQEKYRDDRPARMKEEAVRFGYPFPYLVDATQETAKAYTAACTPDFFLYDQNRKLVYRGQFDDSRPDSGIPVTGRDMRRAVDLVLAGKPAPEDQRPSMGCNIKWRPGNEPAYYG